MMRVEWLKLKGYRPFWFILASYPLVLLATTMLCLRVEGIFMDRLASKSTMAAMVVGRSPFCFPEIWHTMAYLASWFHFIPALLVMLAVTNEFQFRTHRQNLLDGWSRARFFTAKVGLTVLVSVAVTAFVGLVATCVGFAKGSFEWGNLEYLGVFFVQSLSYGMFSLLLAFVFQRGLPSLAFFLIYTKVLEKFASWFVSRHVLTLSYLFPLECANDLVPFPMQSVRAATAKLAQGMPSPGVLLAATLVWLVLYVAASWRLFRDQDL